MELNDATSLVMCDLTIVIQLLQEDIARHKEKVQSLCDTADQFTRQKHFMAAELHDRTKRITERYLVFFSSIIIIVVVVVVVVDAKQQMFKKCKKKYWKVVRLMLAIVLSLKEQLVKFSSK